MATVANAGLVMGTMTWKNVLNGPAPSSLAVDLAARAGLCTIGFTSPERFVTYSAPERVGV